MEIVTQNYEFLDDLFHRVRLAIEDRDAGELRNLSEEITRRFAVEKNS